MYLRKTMKLATDIPSTLERVLMRCDFNVPMRDGKVLDLFRIKTSLPTIRMLRDRGHKVVLVTHLGDPGGKVVESLKLAPIAEALRELGISVSKAQHMLGKEAKNAVKHLQPGGVFLLENIRFHEGEERNDVGFSKSLSELGDVYVNDALSVCHRSHASVVGVPSLLPSYAGLHLESEVRILSEIKENPQKPFVVIVGGAKVESKGRVIEQLIKKADIVLLGNLIAEKLEKEQPLLLEFPNVVPAIDGIMEGGRALDIGHKTRELFLSKIKDARTVFWTGPLGMVEEERFRSGSLEIAKFLASSPAIRTVAGGGDLAAFLGREKLRESFGHVSTGGGATLHFLAGEKLPGLEVLN